MDRTLPPMEPLAPIIDQMREISRQELPGARTGVIRLWDDGTILVAIYHSMGDDGKEVIRYEPTTSEIVWDHVNGYRLESVELTAGETILEPEFERHEIRHIKSVEPPYS